MLTGSLDLDGETVRARLDDLLAAKPDDVDPETRALHELLGVA